MSKKDKGRPQINNLVAKHANEFNKATVFDDKKKSKKKGYMKHKKSFLKDFYSLYNKVIRTI